MVKLPVRHGMFMFETTEGEAMTTILGASPTSMTPEEWAKRQAKYPEEEKAREVDREIFQELLECLGDDYENGDLTMGDLVKLAMRWTDNFERQPGRRLDDRGRVLVVNKLLMDRVSVIKPKKEADKLKPNQLPPSIKKAIADLVVRALQDGMTRSINTCEGEYPNSAFKFISELMNSYGVEVKESSVKDYYYDHRGPTS